MRILAAIPSLTDLRHAFRSLRRARTAFGLATASLAIGIAMCVTMAGVLDTIVSPNIPIERPGDLYEVGWAASFRMAPRGTPRPNPDSALQRIATVKAIAKPPRGFVGGIISASGSTLIEGYGTGVDPTTLAMLGVRPMHGRLFVAPASGPIDGREAVLSEALWRQLYRGKRPFAPFTLHVDGHTLNVVGVAEPRLDRILGGKFWIQASDPLGRLNFESRYDFAGGTLVRVRPGITEEELRVALAGVSGGLAAAARIPARNAGFEMRRLARRAESMPVLAIAVSWAALAVLLLACVNIANLQLVRGLSRLRDLAVRVAVGASRADVVRVQLAESTVIALTGGAAGAFLSFVFMNLVRATAPGELIEQGFVDPQFSWRVVAASIVLTGLAAMLFGLLPALRVSRFDVNVLLQAGAGTGTTRRSHRYYGALVVVEVAFAMALAVCAALLGTTVLAAETFDYGYTSRELIAGSSNIGYGDSTTSILSVTRQRWESVRALPEIASASFQIEAEFDRAVVTTDDPSHERARRGMPRTDLVLVDRDFFTTLGAEVRGPGFRGYDGAAPVAVLDSVAARMIFGYTDPVGHRIKLGHLLSDRPWVTVVGVSKHLLRLQQMHSVGALIEPQIFVLDQTGASVTPGPRLTSSLWIARSKTTAAEAFPILRDRLAPASVVPLDEMNGRNRTARVQGFVASIFLAFAVVGMGLAMLGVYSVMAYSVSQRRREFGVRIAFGATGPSLARMVLLHINVPILAGLAFGLIAARFGEWELGNYVGAFENVAQVVVYLVAPMAMFGAAMAAGLSSALSASRTNAVEAIRGN